MNVGNFSTNLNNIYCSTSLVILNNHAKAKAE